MNSQKWRRESQSAQRALSGNEAEEDGALIVKPFEQITTAELNLSWLIGRSVTDVSFQEPERWYFTFGGDGGIGAECLWRILKHGRIALCSNDHGQKFGLPAHIDAAAKGVELLANRIVETCHVRETTTDITIGFSGDFLLEVIP